MAVPSSTGHQRVTAATPSQAVPTHELTTGTLLPAPWHGAEGGGMPQLVQQVWSRPGRGAGRTPSTGQPFPKQWEMCRGCAWPCGSTWVPYTTLCVGPECPWGSSSPPQALSKGQLWESLLDSGPKSRWNMKTHGQGWEGSRCPSRGVMAASTAKHGGEMGTGGSAHPVPLRESCTFPLPQARAALDVLNCPKVGVPEPGATCRRDCGQEPDTDTSHSGSTLGVRKLQRTRT